MGEIIHFRSQGQEYDTFWRRNLVVANGIVHHLWSQILRTISRECLDELSIQE